MATFQRRSRRLSFGMSRRTAADPDERVAFILHILSAKDGRPLTWRGDSRVGAPGLRRSCGPGQQGEARSIQLVAVCARGWLGGVYMEAQKGWSLTSAHSAAMRSFLQK